MLSILTHRKLKAIKKFMTPSRAFEKKAKEKFLGAFDAKARRFAGAQAPKEAREQWAPGFHGLEGGFSGLAAAWA